MGLTELKEAVQEFSLLHFKHVARTKGFAAMPKELILELTLAFAGPTDD